MIAAPPGKVAIKASPGISLDCTIGLDDDAIITMFLRVFPDEPDTITSFLAHLAAHTEQPSTNTPTVDTAATPGKPLCAPTPSSPVAALPCPLKSGPQALAECHSAGTSEAPLGFRLPQAHHDQGCLTEQYFRVHKRSQ
ncbi:hypothetical protein L7F22_056371, partial [Adiantum nelumboides]|nr:hypothetical protein [Adiantum nelumboides]